jgi:glycerophosphoryl diester phosphodiesterase
MTAWTQARWIAHRCGGRRAPENSLAGLRAAAAAGWRAVEFDVMLSADRTPWLIHDETLERTSFSSGAVGHQPDTVLSGVDISRGAPAAFRGERLPRLTAALRLCATLDLAANVEIKPFPGADAATGAEVARVAAAGGLAADAVLLSSFSELALAAAREAAPQLARALLFEQVPADWPRRVDALAAVAIHCHFAQRDWNWLAAAKTRGLAVRAYTVDDAQTAARLFAIGVDAVFSDAVGEVDLAPAPTCNP